MGSIRIIFDGPPGPEPPRFVEVEDEEGNSIHVGEWIETTAGFWALRLPLSSQASDETPVLESD
jgi:hypothetical protein